VDPSLAQVVGQRIKRLRVQSGNGLREQAREIGISASSLSALENHQGGMSLSQLQRVASHFGLHITDLLAEDGGNGDGRPAEELRPEVVRSWASSLRGVERAEGVLYQLLGSGASHDIQPYLISFQPGAGYERDQIAHPGEEFAYVLLGTVELLLGDEVHRLEHGDAIRFRPEIPHAFRNGSSKGMAVLIGCASPPW
jgi:HTH-type transcriptional repressor of puuD